jgi:hypothetical protein
MFGGAAIPYDELGESGDLPFLRGPLAARIDRGGIATELRELEEYEEDEKNKANKAEGRAITYLQSCHEHLIRPDLRELVQIFYVDKVKFERTYATRYNASIPLGLLLAFRSQVVEPVRGKHRLSPNWRPCSRYLVPCSSSI